MDINQYQANNNPKQKTTDITETNNLYQPNIDDNRYPNTNSNTNKTKKEHYILKIFAIATIITIVLFFFLDTVVRNYLFPPSSNPDTSEFQSYLENKYGKNLNFSHEKGTCIIFNVSWCDVYFTSEEVDKPFKVRFDRAGSDRTFSDNYWLARNESSIDSFYRNLFNDIIPYEYSLSFDGTLENQDESTITAEELLNCPDFNINIDIEIGNRDIPNLEERDILKSQIEKIAIDNPVPSIKSVDISNREQSSLFYLRKD